MILSSGTELQAPLGELKLPVAVAVAAVAEVSAPAVVTPSAPFSLEEVERRHIAEVLEQTRGVIGGKGGRRGDSRPACLNVAQSNEETEAEVGHRFIRIRYKQR